MEPEKEQISICYCGLYVPGHQMLKLAPGSNPSVVCPLQFMSTEYLFAGNDAGS